MAPLRSWQSPQRQQLIRELQRINFGRIDNLTIRNGEPVLDPPPSKQFEFKFAGENGPRPELDASDFQLRQQVVELFAFFDERQNGVIDVLEIKHGLPFRMIVKDVQA